MYIVASPRRSMASWLRRVGIMFRRFYGLSARTNLSPTVKHIIMSLNLMHPKLLLDRVLVTKRRRLIWSKE